MTIHEEIKNNEFVLYRDEDLLVVLDHDPISIGHALILPQATYLDVDDLPLALLDKIMQTAQQYLQLLKLKYDPPAYGIMQNGGGFNDIDVFHLHIFPCFAAADFGWKKKMGSVDQFIDEEFKMLFAEAMQDLRTSF